MRAIDRPPSVLSTGRALSSAPAGPTSPTPVTVIVPPFSTAPDGWWYFSQSVPFMSPRVSVSQPRRWTRPGA